MYNQRTNLTIITTINNFLRCKVEVGCLRDQELPLLASSSKMETTPMAGKSPTQPWASTQKEKTGTHNTDKLWKKKGGRDRGGRQPPRSSQAQENANAHKTMTKTPTKLLHCNMAQDRKESWCMRKSKRPLAAWVKLVLLVVYFCLIAFNCINNISLIPKKMYYDWFIQCDLLAQAQNSVALHHLLLTSDFFLCNSCRLGYLKHKCGLSRLKLLCFTLLTLLKGSFIASRPSKTLCSYFPTFRHLQMLH